LKRGEGLFSDGARQVPWGKRVQKEMGNRRCLTGERNPNKRGLKVKQEKGDEGRNKRVRVKGEGAFR